MTLRPDDAAARPRISVIVPALNEEKLLERMLKQFTPELRTKHGIEVVVSDGGSTDDTLRIARAHADRVVENADRIKQTISMGRNLGARQARGELFLFLNSDTLVKDVDTFLTVIQREIRVEGRVALTCSVEVYPDECRNVDRWFHGFYNWFFFMMNKVGMAMGRGECHIIPREIYFRVGGYADRIAAGEDYDMFHRLEKLGFVKFLRELTVYESPRRYRRYGYPYVTASWFMNFLAVFFLNRSILDEWKPVR
jgi:glycosyltransferase involved in cell wall biosynthesis